MPELTREERAESVKQTFANFALDGLYPSSQTRADTQAYIAGEKTADALVEETRTRYGRL